ncbi:MAG: peptidoglycan DD-metalloendopeptidase family protein [Clostridiaceae bacterium]|nr:peptidoglycan DD-metalloendopeptidase family protein [Clostridiaceae bacterium]
MMQSNHRNFSAVIRRVGYIIIMCLMAIAMTIQVSADDLSKYQQQLKETQSDLSYYRKQIKKISEDINWRKYKREQIVKELEALGLKKEEIEQKIQLIESAIDSLNEAIALAEEEYAQQEALLKQRLNVMYKCSSTVWKLDELLKSSNWNEFFIRLRLMNQISEYDRMLLNSVNKKKQEIEELKAQRQYEMDNCVEQARQYALQIQELEVSRSSIDAAIQKDLKSKEEYEKQEDELLKESRELEELIRNMQSQGDLEFGGKMVWPMPTNKKIASKYGNRLHPIYKVWKMHTGIDIGSKLNEKIVAAADGIVIYAGTRGGYGNCIIIDHGSGITTLYAHINNRGFLVQTGQRVKAGQAIAKAGKTGVATGPHLHFEVRKNGATQDPLKYVKP